MGGARAGRSGRTAVGRGVGVPVRWRRGRPAPRSLRATRRQARGDADGERRPRPPRCGARSSSPRPPGVPLGPNPRVGAVLLDADGRTSSREGYHRGAGTPHAEVDALAGAGGRARGATAVVTLEPCNHTGRTGPCAEALRRRRGRARGRSRQADPNPVAAGGADRLRAAGVDVEGGVLADEAARAQRRRGRSRSRTAGRTSPGSSPPPSTAGSRPPTAPAGGSPARRRAPTCTRCGPTVDAVLVGTGTVLADDPRLTVRDRWQRRARPAARAAAAARRGGHAAAAADGPRPRRRAPRRSLLPTHDVVAALADAEPARRPARPAGGRADAGRRVRRGRAGRPGRRLRRAGPARGRAPGAGRRGHQHASPRRCGCGRRTSPASATTSASPPRSVTRRGGLRCSPGSSRSSARSSPSTPQRTRSRLTVRGPLVVSDATHGASIAVNGVCLTVVEHDRRHVHRRRHAETLERTSLGALRLGSPVNLERPVTLADRLGGHLVQGHVDGTGTVLERTPGEHWEVVRVVAAARLWRATSSRRARSPSTASR